MEQRIIDYKVTIAVLRNLRNKGLLTEGEFWKAEQQIAEKYGLSLGSIFREIT